MAGARPGSRPSAAPTRAIPHRARTAAQRGFTRIRRLNPEPKHRPPGPLPQARSPGPYVGFDSGPGPGARPSLRPGFGASAKQAHSCMRTACGCVCPPQLDAEGSVVTSPDRRVDGAFYTCRESRGNTEMTRTQASSSSTAAERGEARWRARARTRSVSASPRSWRRPPTCVVPLLRSSNGHQASEQANEQNPDHRDGAAGARQLRVRGRQAGGQLRRGERERVRGPHGASGGADCGTHLRRNGGMRRLAA